MFPLYAAKWKATNPSSVYWLTHSVRIFTHLCLCYFFTWFINNLNINIYQYLTVSKLLLYAAKCKRVYFLWSVIVYILMFSASSNKFYISDKSLFYITFIRYYSAPFDSINPSVCDFALCLSTIISHYILFVGGESSFLISE